MPRAWSAAVKPRPQVDKRPPADWPAGASIAAREAVKRARGVPNPRAARGGRRGRAGPAGEAEGAARSGGPAAACERVRLARAPDRRALGRVATAHCEKGGQRLRLPAAEDPDQERLRPDRYGRRRLSPKD